MCWLELAAVERSQPASFSQIPAISLNWRVLPRPLDDKPAKTEGDFWPGFVRVFALYFKKPGILVTLGFLLLYRFPEAQLLKLAGNVRYEIDPANPYPDQYTGHMRVTLDDGSVVEERQPHLRGVRVDGGDEGHDIGSRLWRRIRAVWRQR